MGMVGLGLMGHGIAQSAATAGYDVVAVDMNDQALDTGMQRIEKSMQKMLNKSVEKGKLDQSTADQKFKDTFGRIQPTTNLNDLADCDLVIEAIVEDMTIKTPFYKQLGEIVKPEGIFASNTSSLPIHLMAEPSGRPERTVGLHFFNPVQMMKLVEVIRTDKTDPAVFEASKAWATSLGKVAVSCNDTPGFIVNRLLVPYLSQALLLLERGDATKEDIDLSMQFGAGHPMGPIALADYVGLDTTLFILDGWVSSYPNEPAFVVPDILRQKVKEGKLGRKTGEGFYKWQGDKKLN